MKSLTDTPLYAALLSLELIVSPAVLAGESSLPEEPQAQSPATQSVQEEVDSKVKDKADEQRKQILANASAALDETEKALRALEENNTEAALTSLEVATGKLELILARDPSLALAPVDVDVVTHDLLASLDTVKAMIHDAEEYLEDGEIQMARPLVTNLASEIVIETSSIPLATYPDAIKAITPLIDAGRIDEAKSALRAALRTLVVTQEVIPLPILRAEQLLDSAEALAEKKARSARDNENLAELLKAAQSQLKLAELLGYGTEESFEPIYEQLDQIEDQTAGGKGGKGWFDRIKAQLTELL
jgi:hypothetical protein